MCLPWKASLTSSPVLFFIVWEEAQSSRIMRLFVPFANLPIVARYFVVVAGQREHVRVLPEVLPVGSVLQKGWTHDEYVVKIPFEILFQHFQKVMCLSAGGHANDKYVKECTHLVLPFGQYSTPWSLLSTTLIIPSATTKTWHERSVVVAFFSISRRTLACVR